PHAREKHVKPAQEPNATCSNPVSRALKAAGVAEEILDGSGGFSPSRSLRSTSAALSALIAAATATSSPDARAREAGACAPPGGVSRAPGVRVHPAPSSGA